MTDVRRFGSLEITLDHEFQRRTWVAQRWAWAIMTVVLIAGLFGLFGPGVFGGRTTEAANGSCRLRYDRFLRWRGTGTLKFEIRPSLGQEEASIWLTDEYVQGIDVESVRPEPDRVEVGGDRSAFVFRLTGSERPIHVTFGIRPEVVGSLNGQASLDDGNPIGIDQFVYP